MTALAVEHRRAVSAICLLTEQEQATIWARLAGLSADEIRDALMELVPALAAKYGAMAATIAADFYDTAREQAMVRGRFAAVPADIPGRARFESMVRWGVGPLYSGAPDRDAARTRVVGALQLVVSNAARDTVTANSVRDPAADGWRREARGGGCTFCRMLAGRGPVYRESTARFATHENCHCVASPAFDGGREASALQYVASKRDRTPAEQSRLREHLASGA